MKKRISMRGVIGRRSYTTTELAKTVRVHPQTIRSWQRMGLQAIDETKHHPLFLGSEVKRYYAERVAKRKVKLAPNEVFCFHCKKGCYFDDASIEETGRLIGRGKPSLRLTAKCRECGSRVSKACNFQIKFLLEEEGIKVENLTPLNRSLASGKE